MHILMDTNYFKILLRFEVSLLMQVLQFHVLPDQLRADVEDSARSTFQFVILLIMVMHNWSKI